MGFFDDNLIALSHTVDNIERGVPFFLKDKKIPERYSRTPVFVIANGPSLDASISFIEKIEIKQS
ncbi:hypothetical protein ACSZMT_14675 [Aeromonas veronii]